MAFYPAIPTAGSTPLPIPVIDGGTGLSVTGSQLPWVPADNNLLTANGDPWQSQNTFLMIAGTVYLMKLTARSAFTVTNIWLGLQTAGSGTSTGCYVGLYSSTGSLLSGSSDIAASLTGTTGPISNPLTTPQAVAAGSSVWVAVLCNLGTTQATLYKSAGVAPGLGNVNLIAANYRFAVNGTLQTSLPGSITPSSNAAPGGAQFWAGVS
jgi:hypothetical protein